MVVLHSLYIVAINSLSEIFANVFYHSVGFLFTSWLFLSVRFFNPHYCNWIDWWLNKYFMWLSPQVRSVILQRLCLAFKSLVSNKCLTMNERIYRVSQVTWLSQSCTTTKRQHQNRKSGFWIRHRFPFAIPMIVSSLSDIFLIPKLESILWFHEQMMYNSQYFLLFSMVKATHYNLLRELANVTKTCYS